MNKDGKYKSKIEKLPADYYDPKAKKCFLCGSSNSKTISRLERFTVPLEFKRCQCGLIKQTPMPNEKFFEWFFNSDIFLASKYLKVPEIWGYYDYFIEEINRLKTSKRRFDILKYLFERDHPLEVMKIGPATGTFLHVIKKHGHNVLGCDASKHFINYAQEKYGVQIDHGRYENMGYANEKFDLIFLFSVFENIPNVEEFLTSVNRTLKTNGYFVFNFVDMENNFIASLQGSKYFLYRPPACYIYNNKVLRGILNKYNFEIIKIHQDIRYVSLEKIFTSFRLNWLNIIFHFLNLNRLSLRVYAYPSKIVVAKKIKSLA
jgi:2-polyprenyl-3-methyl-5-hydroxy-6-metoxy-1,4-benzoquinol methylase